MTVTTLPSDTHIGGCFPLDTVTGGSFLFSLGSGDYGPTGVAGWLGEVTEQNLFCELVPAPRTGQEVLPLEPELRQSLEVSFQVLHI